MIKEDETESTTITCIDVINQGTGQELEERVTTSYIGYVDVRKDLGDRVTESITVILYNLE